MNWTEEQKNAIYKNKSNILVAAAAGSGKTAVLVERIIQKILLEKIDIDKLLVVTFTNAAAAEMRERVLEAIYKKIEDEPENEHLQKQLVLLAKSNICTIHSFCLEVIKNNFFEIDLSSNFRIGSEEEIELLRQEVLEDLFEKLYEEQDEKFSKLVEIYTGYKGDEPLKEIILKIYNFIQSMPFPKEWLEKNVEKFKTNFQDKDFFETDWGKILLKEIEDEVIDAINALKVYRNKTELYFEMDKFTNVLSRDIEKLKEFQKCINTSWDEAFDYFYNISFDIWPRDKNVTLSLKEEVKEARDIIKKKLSQAGKKIFLYKSQEAFEDIFQMYEVLEILEEIILKFSEEYRLKKKEKNIVDFNDIEHYALEILVRKDANGNYIPTEVAKKYQNKFVEIAIDEYQDSNQVQEYILTQISNGKNIFMVGDVKQSIYKFRQACPEIFLDKYNKYSIEGNDKGLKIQLFKNFRSKANVLDLTNCIFQNIMSKQLGDIDYTEEEFLNLGAEFEDKENGLKNAELHIIDLEDDSEEEDNNEEEKVEKQVVEARFVAQKIEELVNSKVLVKDKKLGYRPITYKDIVILLRSTAHIAPIFEKELLNKDIPVFTDSTSEYLDTIEIQTIMNLLKILDNPIDDIALVSVLRSQLGKFTDNELVEIRLVNKDVNFYKVLLEAKEVLQGDIKLKIEDFLNKIDNWREKSQYLNLAELIWKIYNDTGFYNYVGLMPNGSLRQANLKILFERAKEYEKTSFKGLFNFIRFIEKLKLGNGDMSAAKIIGENENVVRIMSIHKSKGLEFPVVFLSNTSKKINMQDLSKNILLHQGIGFGPEYINYERKIRYSTAAKQAIKIAIRQETISEEMRVLYVALTRAKEKLIITGTEKNNKKSIQKKQDFIKLYNMQSNKINPILVKKYTSFLDWIELVIYKQKIDNLIDVKVHYKNELLEKKQEKIFTKREFDFNQEIDYEKIKNKLNYEYLYKISTILPNKSTVTKIKELDNEQIDFETLSEVKIGLSNIKPKFLNEDEKIANNEKGTLMHLILQKIDFKQEYDEENLKQLLQELVSKRSITTAQASIIDLNKILHFLNTDFSRRIKNAKQIFKEKPFCTKLLAKEIYNEAEDETILVQGIIDLFLVDENDKLVLVDYKTDYVEKGKEKNLLDKYKKQLQIYKKALEEALERSVDEVYIYSLFLNKEIEL